MEKITEKNRNTNTKTLNDTKRFLIIMGCDIKPMEEPFWGGKYANENDYMEMLEQMQSLFEEFEKTDDVKPPTYEHMDDIILNREEQRIYDNFVRTFVSPANRINVLRDEDGKYYATCDGQHRLYVARKYNLKILVYIK